MCNSLNAIGLTQDRSNSAEFVGGTAAHELGHIFNMNHDDGTQSKSHTFQQN